MELWEFEGKWTLYAWVMYFRGRSSLSQYNIFHYVKRVIDIFKIIYFPRKSRRVIWILWKLKTSWKGYLLYFLWNLTVFPAGSAYRVSNKPYAWPQTLRVAGIYLVFSTPFAVAASKLPISLVVSCFKPRLKNCETFSQLFMSDGF